jgi:SSS family solute:Na+ symporter
LLTWDVYRKWRPGASEARLVFVGRVTTVILVFVGLAWIPAMKFVSPQLYIYLQSIQAYIAPPIAAVFLLGVLSPRLNGKGALAALWSGFVFGCSRLLLELGKSKLTPGSFWYWLASINFLHFAALLFLLCSAILIVVSMMTPPPAPERVADLTLQTVAPSDAVITSPKERNFEIALSVLLVAIIGALWIVFRLKQLSTRRVGDRDGPINGEKNKVRGVRLVRGTGKITRFYLAPLTYHLFTFHLVQFAVGSRRKACSRLT